MENKIIQVICQFANIDSLAVSAGQTFKSIGLSSSIKLIRLHRQLEKETGKKIPAITPDSLVSDVLSQLGGAAPAQAAAQAAPAPARTMGKPAGFDISIGTDIEELDNLPESVDYLNDDFYQSVFQPEEIKYAIAAKNPRIHLCGMFCAKEALIKSNKLFAGIEMKNICVKHDSDGAPHLELPGTVNNVVLKLSISHTEKMATAVVLCMVNG